MNDKSAAGQTALRRLLVSVGLTVGILAISGFWSGAAWADTIVPAGTIQDTLWTAAGSPYRVQGDISLPGGSALTIQPGVQVLFDGNYQFVIQGRLIASGTVSDSIVFSASSSQQGWGGLRFLSAQVYSRLDYCRFELGWAQRDWPGNCGGAIYLYGSIEAINHCSFVNNRADYDGGAVFIWGGAPQFSYNLFFDNLCSNGNGHALYLGDCDGVVLNHLTIAGNGAGPGNSLIMANDGSHFVMTNSILWDSYQFFTFVPGEITYNCIDPTYLATQDSLLVFGSGNIGFTEGSHEFDPYFLDLANGDLRVQSYSQTIDAASPSSPFDNELEPNGDRADMGAYGNSAQAAVSLPLLSFAPYVRNVQAPSFTFGLQKLLTPGADTTFAIHNVGRLPLILDSLIFSDDQFRASLVGVIDPVYGEMVVLPDTSMLCSLFFMPTAIDSVDGVMSFLDNDATSDPEVSLAGVGVNPVMDLIPDTIHFEETNVGDTSNTALLGIKNIGQNGNGIQSLLILSIFASSDNFKILNPDSDASNITQISDTIAVDSIRYYPVIFTPTERLDFAENLTVGSRNAGSQLLHATGTGSQPILEFDTAQDTLSYSVVVLGADSTQVITFGNSGPIDLTISRPVLNDSTNYSFEFSGLEVSVPPGGEMEIPVSFHPTTAGPHNTTMDILTNEPTTRGSTGWNYRTVTIRLIGTGTSQTNWVIGDNTGLWEAENSPYYLVGDVSVPLGGELSIAAGVEVLTEGDFEFTVNGTLEALGTSADPIKFTTIDESFNWVGMTFQQGSSASLLHSCEFFRGEAAAGGTGGVVRIIGASPTFEQCEFYDNAAPQGQGGAVALQGDAQPLFNDCRFYQNEAASGGALFADWFARPQIAGCDFFDNNATNGGALYLSGALGKVWESRIYNNVAAVSGTDPATGLGGGVYLGNGAATEMFGNEIYGNQAASGGGVAIVWYTQPFIHDEAIYDNSAANSGGGIYVKDGSGPVILKTIVAENTAAKGSALSLISGAAIVNYGTFVAVAADSAADGWLVETSVGDETIISNSILWGTPGSGSGSALSDDEQVITYSDVLWLGEYPGLGNVNDDPEFVGSGNVWQRYALSESSPLLDKSEDGEEIGAGGGSSTLDWNLTLAVVEHPVQIYQAFFALTSTVPLTSPPYAYMETDFPDTLAWTAVDSGSMVAVSAGIWRLGVLQNANGYPSRLTITAMTILGDDTTLVQEWVGGELTAGGSSLDYYGVVKANSYAVPQVAEGGYWGLIPEAYGSPKPLDLELQAVGPAFQVFSSASDLGEATIEFDIEEAYNGISPTPSAPDLEHYAIARWNGESWVELPSFLNPGGAGLAGASVWCSLDEEGSYRLVWGEGIRSTMLPEKLELYQNYPNPFNPETSIAFALPSQGQVRLEIFDLLGRRVAELIDGTLPAGVHRRQWDAAQLASGIYFYRLQTGGHQISKKMILMK
jgi:hypothetical protein